MEKEWGLEFLCRFIFFVIMTSHNPFLSSPSSLSIFIRFGAGGLGIWTGFLAEWRQEGFQRGQGDKDYVQRSKASFSGPFKALPPLIPTCSQGFPAMWNSNVLRNILNICDFLLSSPGPREVLESRISRSNFKRRKLLLNSSCFNPISLLPWPAIIEASSNIFLNYKC